MPAQMHPGTLNFASRPCVLFDFDGTLVNTGRGILKCMRYALESNGITEYGGEKGLRRFVGPPFREALRDFCGVEGEFAAKIIGDYRAMYAADGLYDCELYPGALGCVSALRAAGRRLAVATSKPIHFARELLEKFGFLPLFECVIGAENDAHAGKAEIVRRALDCLSVRSDDAVMVGDRKYDVLGAAANGIPCIAFCGGYEEEGEFVQAGACAVAENYAALSSMLLGK